MNRGTHAQAIAKCKHIQYLYYNIYLNARMRANGPLFACLRSVFVAAAAAVAVVATFKNIL